MNDSFEVKVIVKPQHYKPGWFCFDIIFHDGYIKSYALDNYELMSYRASERDIIEHLAKEFYEQVTGTRPEKICLIFY